MPLSGTFDTMQLTDVIQWIHATTQSGALTVSVELEDTHLIFEEGEVQGVWGVDSIRLIRRSEDSEGRPWRMLLSPGIRGGGRSLPRPPGCARL